MNTHELFTYLLDTLLMSLNHRQRNGEPAIVLEKERVANLIGFRDVDALNWSCIEIDNWSDFNKLPSLTCMFRPVPRVENLHYYDIHTHTTKTNDLKFERHFLELIAGGQSAGGGFQYTIATKPWVDNVSISTPVKFGNVFDQHERALCEKLYGRLGMGIPKKFTPKNIETIRQMIT